MKLQAEQFAEVFNHLRDTAKPVTQQDAADLAALRAPAPPSKAHLKRLERHASGVRFVQPIVKNREISPETLILRKQNDFHKMMIAEMGGSRTIAPTDRVSYDPTHKRFFTFIDSVYSGEHEFPAAASR